MTFLKFRFVKQMAFILCLTSSLSCTKHISNPPKIPYATEYSFTIDTVFYKKLVDDSIITQYQSYYTNILYIDTLNQLKDMPVMLNLQSMWVIKGISFSPLKVSKLLNQDPIFVFKIEKEYF